MGVAIIPLSNRASSASPADVFACPIDTTSLQSLDGKTLVCAHGHSFDRARDGHVNLLVVQHKASRDPGDSKAMVAARRRFLDAGHFAPIAQHSARIVGRLECFRDKCAAVFHKEARQNKQLGSFHDSIVTGTTLAAGPSCGARPMILDAGCGEGYYLSMIAKALDGASAGHPRLAGIDISKWAIHAASKRHPGCAFAVATNRHLPFAPGSVDLIMSMFGFPIWESFAAVQSPSGFVLTVDPGPDHLLELRSIIYPSVNRSPPPSLEAAVGARYRLEDETRLEFPFELTSAEQIADLLTMTPHNHRAPLSGRLALARLDRLSLTGDVVVRLLRRHAA